MSRNVVMVTDKKDKIQKIKNKYKNLEMTDSAADKIIKLEVTNRILKAATAAVGIVTFIDYIIPDPILGFDEVALTGLTGLLGYASSIVDNKIDSIVEVGNAKMEMEEVTNLTSKLTSIAKNVKESKTRANSENNVNSL